MAVNRDLYNEWEKSGTLLDLQSWLAAELEQSREESRRHFKERVVGGALLNRLVERLNNRGLHHLITDDIKDFLRSGEAAPEPAAEPAFSFSDLRENMLLWSEDRTFFWLVDKQDNTGCWLLWGYKWGPNDKPMRGTIYPDEKMEKWVPLSEQEAFDCPTFGRWLPWDKLYPHQWHAWIHDPALQMERGENGFGSTLTYYGIKLRTEP